MMHSHRMKEKNSINAILRNSIPFVLVLPAMLLVSIQVYSKAVIYDTRDGLTSNTVQAIAKDKEGLMWIGTNKGLNIFDGYTFTKSKGALSALTITALAFNESRNEILAGTNKGLYAVNLRTMQPTRLHYTPTSKILQKERVNAIYSSPHDKALYALLGERTVVRINKDNELEILLQIPGKEENIKKILCIDKNNLLVICSKIYSYDLLQRKLTLIPEFRNILAGNAEIYDKKILVNNNHTGLTLLNLNSFRQETPVFIKKYQSRFNNRTIFTVKNNNLYAFGDDYTFFIINLSDGKVTEISKKYPVIFEGKVCNALWVDEHEVAWVATNKGLIRVTERKSLFTRSLYNFPGRVSTRKMLEEKSGDIYVCSYAGLWHFQKERRTWTQYSGSLVEDLNNSTISHNRIAPLCLVPDSTGNYLYIGYDSDRLIRFNNKRKIFEIFPYTEKLNGETIHGISSIIRHKNTLWLGTNNGLASYNIKASVLTLHKNDPYDIGRFAVRFLHQKKNQHLVYAGTDNGLYIIDVNKGILEHYNTDTRPSLSHNEVLFVDEDDEGNLWMGTHGGGINILSADKKEIHKVRKQDGLSNEIVYAIIPQDSNTLWISTFSGLSRYRKDQRSFNNFFEEEGLASDEFNQNSFLKTSEGEILLGSINGIISFYPETVTYFPSFKIFASGISRWNNKTKSLELDRKPIYADHALIKTPTDQIMEVHLGCTDYSDPSRNSYSYRIREIEDTWISLEDRHSINLGALPYGSYVIEVKAISSHGDSSANILTFHVKIVQPFYKTWWFYALILLTTATLLYIAYLMKYWNFKNVLQLRMKIASNLHDDVGSLLTRITLFADNLRYSVNSEEQKKQKLEKISALCRDAVASMSDVLWAIDSRNDFAGNLLDRMQEYTEDMLSSSNIDVHLHVSGTNLKQPIPSNVRREIYLLYKEAINNIVKHTSATHVNVTYWINNKHFILKITNDGIHHPIEAHTTGQGLNNMLMRAKRIDAKLKIERTKELFILEVRNYPE